MTSTHSHIDAFSSLLSLSHSSNGPTVFTRFCIRTLPFSKPELSFSGMHVLFRTHFASLIDTKVFRYRLKIGARIFVTPLFLIVPSFPDHPLDWKTFYLFEGLGFSFYLPNLLLSLNCEFLHDSFLILPFSVWTLLKFTFFKH